MIESVNPEFRCVLIVERPADIVVTPEIINPRRVYRKLVSMTERLRQ